MFKIMGDKKIFTLWQLLFMTLSTSWLWAPYLNPIAESRTTMISTYEAAMQPYSWLFRVCDILGALLLFLMARYISSTYSKRLPGLLLTIISVGLFVDAIFATTCTLNGSECSEVLSFSFIVHATESGITGLTVAALAIYDILQRKRWSTIIFFIVQILYALLFVTGLAKEAGIATLSQFLYQTSLIVWVTWLCRELLNKHFAVHSSKTPVIKQLIATWAFLNGILAILVSLAHIHLFGKIKGLYFAGDSAWLAQHGVIIGVTMLYLSRHLFRGELRARQIFMFISGIEVLKYALITPHPALLVLYFITFLGLFVFKDEFDRGTVPLTWSGRLKDLYFMAGGLAVTIFFAFLILDRDSRVSTISLRTFEHFFSYINNQDILHGSHLRSALLAHTISVFLCMIVASVLWVLFRPYKSTAGTPVTTADVLPLLTQYSHSSEDYFKQWPLDKVYFQNEAKDTFIAYKVVGSVAYALADPVGAAPSQTLNQFTAWCKEHRLTTCFLPVYDDSLKMYINASFEQVHIGSSAVISIDHFLSATIKSKWWRWQRNRAQKFGYEHRVAIPPHSRQFLTELHTVSDEWLQREGRMERGFSLGYFDEKYLQECTIHYLVDSNEKVVAFSNILPQFNQTFTTSIDLLRYRQDADNAMPYLLYKTIEYLHEHSPAITQFDLGFVPFAKAQGPLLQIAKTLSAGRFSAKGLEQFKNKFEPDWQPNYLVYEGDVVDLATVALGLERVMNSKE